MVEAKLAQLMTLVEGLTSQEVDEKLRQLDNQVEHLLVLRELVWIRDGKQGSMKVVEPVTETGVTARDLPSLDGMRGLVRQNEEQRPSGFVAPVFVSKETMDHMLSETPAKPIELEHPVLQPSLPSVAELQDAGLEPMRRRVGQTRVRGSWKTPSAGSAAHKIQALLQDGQRRTAAQISTAIGVCYRDVVKALQKWRNRLFIAFQLPRTGCGPYVYWTMPEVDKGTILQDTDALATKGAEPSSMALSLIEFVQGKTPGTTFSVEQIAAALKMTPAKVRSCLLHWERRSGLFTQVQPDQWVYVPQGVNGKKAKPDEDDPLPKKRKDLAGLEDVPEFDSKIDGGEKWNAIDAWLRKRLRKEPGRPALLRVEMNADGVDGSMEDIVEVLQSNRNKYQPQEDGWIYKLTKVCK